MTAPSFATYATLADVRRLLHEPQTLTAADKDTDASIMEALRWATRWIETKTKRSYFPTVETRYFDAGTAILGGDVLGYDLTLGEGNGIIEVTSVTNGDAAVVSSNDYRLYSRTGNAPYDIIRSVTTAWSIDSTYGARQAIAVAGRWVDSDVNASGFITGYSTLGATLAIGATAATVVWTSDFDPIGRFPLFSPGMLGRFGTSEYFTILSTNRVTGGTNTLDRIKRAERGTTAAEHASGTAIAVWEVEETIRDLCASLAVWKYQNPNPTEGIPEHITGDIDKAAPRYFVRAI